MPRFEAIITRPIERIRATGGVDAIKRQLGAHEEHEESDNGVQRTLAEGYPAIGGLNLGENREKGRTRCKTRKPELIVDDRVHGRRGTCRSESAPSV